MGFYPCRLGQMWLEDSEETQNEVVRRVFIEEDMTEKEKI